MTDNRSLQRIRKQISQFDATHHIEEIGVIDFVGDGIARVTGLNDAMYGEMIQFSNGAYGRVQNLEVDNIGIIILDDYNDIQEGDLVKRTGEIMKVPVGKSLLGRVVDPIGRPIDGHGPIHTTGFRPVEAEAPGIMERKSIDTPLQTGIKAIDALVPIGRGQRELIIGDRKTGKTTLAIDAIINQKDTDVLCVYVAIGQKASTVKNIASILEKNGALSHTIIVSASASQSSSLLYIAPYAATAMAEEFMYQGRDVLIVYDDLSKQATAYREMSLLLKRPPGREAYPGDVFYTHSHLLERSAKLSDELGGGSLTALPIIETQAGDISAYIPTNVISITDGQIFLDHDLFNSGVRPAINAGLSVSRVGGSAQKKAMKQVSGTLRIDLASYRELEAFAQFGADLDISTQRRLKKGQTTVEILKQSAHQTLSVSKQIVMIYALTQDFLEDIAVEDLKRFESEFYDYLTLTYPREMKRLEELGTFKDEEKVKQVIQDFIDSFIPSDELEM